jgi:hypothetical protein
VFGLASIGTLGAVLCAAGALILLGREVSVGKWVGIVACLFGLIVSVWLARAAGVKELLRVPRYQIDRRAGSITMKGAGDSPKSTPLSGAATIQLVHEADQLLYGSWDARLYDLYLGFQDQPESPLHLTTHLDLHWSVEAGKHLAAFLGVQFLNLTEAKNADDGMGQSG